MTATGELNKRITLQYQTRVPDGMGGFTPSWVTAVANIAAAIWPTSAKEQLQAGQVSGEITHRIRVRYRSVLKSSWRVKFGNRYFAILAPPIDPNMKHEWLDLLCKEAT